MSENSLFNPHGTTILGVRRNGVIALGGDGQVTFGNTVMKGNARKVRRLADDKVIAGFAGGTADAFTLFERFEGKLEKYGNLTRAAIELAKDWRSDRYLRRLEALLLVGDPEKLFVISGNGDVIEPEYDVAAIGSGGQFALAAARALVENSTLDARSIVERSLNIAREQEMAKVRERAQEAAEERVLDTLLPKPRAMGFSTDEPPPPRNGETREKLRRMLEAHELDDREIEIELRVLPMGVEIMAPPGMEEMQQQLQSMFQNLGGNRTRTRKLKVREALKLLTDEEAGKLINEDELKVQALANAEQNGIVFIDEIDKVTRRQETLGADVSREGVQRDLLPLVEGSTVATKYGPVKTDHVLFIASGAFSLSKPSDLIPELQGRLPIRVELDSLKVGDFVRILTEPDASLTAQYRALMATEGVEVDFATEGVGRIAEIAFAVNEP